MSRENQRKKCLLLVGSEEAWSQSLPGEPQRPRDGPQEKSSNPCDPIDRSMTVTPEFLRAHVRHQRVCRIKRHTGKSTCRFERVRKTHHAPSEENREKLFPLSTHTTHCYSLTAFTTNIGVFSGSIRGYTVNERKRKTLQKTIFEEILLRRHVLQKQ